MSSRVLGAGALLALSLLAFPGPSVQAQAPPASEPASEPPPAAPASAAPGGGAAPQGSPSVQVQGAAAPGAAAPSAVPSPSAAPTPQATPPEQTAGAGGAAELYHLAFAALADGRAELAASLLERLVIEHPASPLAVRAQEILMVMRAAPEPAPGADEERSRASGTTGIARAELVFAQTVHGLALGAEVCAMLQCENAQPWAGALMVGTGAGFAISFFGSQDGVTPGLSRALTDGVIWGGASGLLLMLAADALDNTSDEGPVVGAYLAGGQLVGLGGAFLLYRALEPTAGQVSLTSSGGLWTLAATAQLLGAVQPDMNENEVGAVLLVASQAGLVAGGLLASSEPMGTSRVLMIDAAGVLGALTGMGLSVLPQDEPEAGPTLGAGFAGTLIGLGLGYYFTRDWDRSAGTEARLGVAPVAGGGAEMTLRVVF